MPVAMSARPDPSRSRVRLISVSEVVRVSVAMRAMMTVPLQRAGRVVQRKVTGCFGPAIGKLPAPRAGA